MKWKEILIELAQMSEKHLGLDASVTIEIAEEPVRIYITEIEPDESITIDEPKVHYRMHCCGELKQP